MNWSTTTANNNHVNADGYTDLKWYLNWLAGPHTVCYRDGLTNVDLRAMVGDCTNFTFQVNNGAHGTVNLAGDGHTAEFVAATGYSGLASFSFNAVDTRTGVGFGPVEVNTLISTNVQPRPLIMNPVFSDGLFRLTVTGETGSDYIIETSTNLTTWNDLSTNHLPALPFAWTNSATDSGQRFYRVRFGY